ncbi:MAG: D-alanyl-D-alanine carboxypeptidase family protein [Clostridia bacterium]|nr:D-alanyl-D-alanine carboxypeptidase family protein [Clostridia bacterium]
MKRNRIIAVLLLLIILFTFSCCKKDEVDPFGNTVPEEITTTENTTEAPSAEESTTEKGKILYATAVVNVREEPNTDCDVIGQLSLGESIELIEHLDNGWSAVRYSGEKYYISTQYLSEKKPSDKSDFVDPLAAERIVVDPTEGNPYLVVVNAKRAADETYKPVLTEIFDTGYYMEEGVTPYYEEMYTAAKKDGITLTPYSAYRSYERQKNNYINLTKQYKSQYKLSEEDAARKAATVILPPGTSEHNLGLAMDICNTRDDFANTKEFKWLTENAHKYGFILRYTAEKQDITGIVPEPWHWRFVGVEYAEAIKESGLCLEEYLGIE